MNVEQILRITMIIGGCLFVPGLVAAAFGAENGLLFMFFSAPFLMVALSLVFIEWRRERVLEHEVHMAELAREAKKAMEDLE